MIQDIYPHVYKNAFQTGVTPADNDIIFSFEEDQVLIILKYPSVRCVALKIRC